MCVNGSKGTCHENPGNKILTMGTLCKACEQVALHGLWMARTDGHLQAPLAAFTSSAMSPILWKASMQISTSVFTAPHCISQLQHNCTTRILLNKKKSPSGTNRGSYRSKFQVHAPSQKRTDIAKAEKGVLNFSPELQYLRSFSYNYFMCKNNKSKHQGERSKIFQRQSDIKQKKEKESSSETTVQHMQ